MSMMNTVSKSLTVKIIMFAFFPPCSAILSKETFPSKYEFSWIVLLLSRSFAEQQQSTLVFVEETLLCP